MRIRQGSWRNMGFISTRSPIMRKADGNAVIIRDTGRGSIIWDWDLGASSLLDHMRFSNTADMKEYIGNSAFPDKIRQNMESLTEADEMAEFMFLGLRMTEGVSMEAFAEYFGKNMENVYGEVLKKHLEIGMLEQKGDRIYLSRKGIHVSNGVMADFLL